MSERPTQAPDAGYFAKKLTVILRDINLYTKPELYRELSRLAEVAKPDEANSIHAQIVQGGYNAETSKMLWRPDLSAQEVTELMTCIRNINLNSPHHRSR